MQLVTHANTVLGAYILAELAKNESIVYAIKSEFTQVDWTQIVFEKYFPEDYAVKLAKIHWIDTPLEAYSQALSTLKVFYILPFIPHSKSIKSFVDQVADDMNVFLAEPTPSKLVILNGAHVLMNASLAITEQDDWDGIHAGHAQQARYYAELEVFRAMAEGLSASLVNAVYVVSDDSKDPNTVVAIKAMGQLQKNRQWVSATKVAQAALALMALPSTQKRWILAPESVNEKLNGIGFNVKNTVQGLGLAQKEWETYDKSFYDGQKLTNLLDVSTDH